MDSEIEIPMGVYDAMLVAHGVDVDTEHDCYMLDHIHIIDAQLGIKFNMKSSLYGLVFDVVDIKKFTLTKLKWGL